MDNMIGILPKQQFGIILTDEDGLQYLGHLDDNYAVSDVSEFGGEQEFDLLEEEILVVEIFSVTDNSIPNQFGDLDQTVHLKEIEHFSLTESEDETEEVSAFDLFVHDETEFHNLTFSAINNALTGDNVSRNT